MTLWRGNEPLVLASQSKARQGPCWPTPASPLKATRPISTSAPSSGHRVFQGQARSQVSWPVKRPLPSRHDVRAVMSSAPIKHLALECGYSTSPRGKAQAAEQLRALSGHCHELHAAIAVARDGKLLFEHVSVARMTMRRLDDKRYRDLFWRRQARPSRPASAPTSSKGWGVHLFERIEGDHFTILGLPLFPLLVFLRGERLLGI